MTNASCADCGRIVAFRTHDPSEISECRNCGTWVKRSAEMPGVAASVKESGPTARKTAIPQRKESGTEPGAAANTTRSASSPVAVTRSDNNEGQNMSPTAVYAAIRDLQKLVYDLRSGQKEIKSNQARLLANAEGVQTSQQALQDGQKTLHSGQKALHSGQKQLFGQCQEIQVGQATLLERTLPVPDMPLANGVPAPQATGIPAGQLSHFDEGAPPINGFYTTPFSSLKIPLIPIRLEDLDIDPQFTEEGSTPTIPEEQRSDRMGLITEPLPQPPPYQEPVVDQPITSPMETAAQQAGDRDESGTQTAAAMGATAPTNESGASEPFTEEVTFPEEFGGGQLAAGGANADSGEVGAQSEASAFEGRPSTEFGAPEEEQVDPFLTTAAHDSPFTIEGPPDTPFTVADPDTDDAAASGVAANGERPFVVAPDPFGAQEHSHEPTDLDDPFAQPLQEDEFATSSSREGSNGVSDANPEHDGGNITAFPDTSADNEFATEHGEAYPSEGTIGDDLEGGNAEDSYEETSTFDPSQRDLLTDAPKKSLFGTLLKLLPLLLAVLAAYLFFFTGFFKSKEQGTTQKTGAALVDFPSFGMPLPQGDERITEAKQVAETFLSAKSVEEASASALPVDNNLMKDFWEPFDAPTIEKTYPGRVLDNGRVEVDFLVKDYGRKETLLPVVKNGEDPFKVNWKAFTECEEATLGGISQGILYLDNGSTLDQGKIRAWVENDPEIIHGLALGQFQGLRVHDFAEKTVALAVVRKGSPAFKSLMKALSETELKYKGKPSIRAILDVKRIEKEDPESKKPARLEIKKVISTDWNHFDASPDNLISEELPEIPERTEKVVNAVKALRPTINSQPAEAPIKPQPAPPQAPQAPEIGPDVPDKLPAVPSEDEPFASVAGESPILELSFD